MVKIGLIFNRLSDGTNYFIDMNALFPLFTKENMIVNKREGEHWKMDIWKNKIVLRNGGKTLHVVPNEKEWISKMQLYLL